MMTPTRAARSPQPSPRQDRPGRAWFLPLLTCVTFVLAACSSGPERQDTLATTTPTSTTSPAVTPKGDGAAPDVRPWATPAPESPPPEDEQGVWARRSGDHSTPHHRPTPAEVLPIQVDVDTAAEVRAEVAAHTTEPLPSLGIWDHVLLGRLLAIDDLVAQHSGYYGTDYLWELLVFSSESTLDPIAKGPEPGDRGLGQVSFESEATTRTWGSDPWSDYYYAGLDNRRSIWDPETNVILATIVLRSIYAVPTVTSNQEAYAIYTDGHAAISPDGHIVRPTEVDVARAASFRDRLVRDLGLKAYVNFDVAAGAEDLRAELSRERVRRLAAVSDPVVRELLAVDFKAADGREAYIALRDLYLRLAFSGEYSGWAQVTYLSEALMLTKLGDVVYGLYSEPQYQTIDALLDSTEAFVLSADERALSSLYGRMVHDVTIALANGGKYIGFPFSP